MRWIQLLICLIVSSSLPGWAGSLDCFHHLHELFRPHPVLRPSIDRETAKALMKALAVYNVESTPLIMAPAMYQEIQRAAIQRARAIRSFLADIYQNHTPKVFSRYPQLEHVLATNPFFVSELVGTEMAHTIRWDYIQAMDWTVRRHPEGHYSIVILESDAGAIGGMYRLALVHQGVVTIAHPDLHAEFLDIRTYLEEISRYHHAMARQFGDGAVLLYTENDKEPLLGPWRRSLLKSWFRDHDIQVASTWNLHPRWWGPAPLTYDDAQGQYVIGRLSHSPISSIMLRYYPASLDPQHESYARVGAGYKTPAEQAHALPNFWNRFVSGGFRRWHQLNPLGVDVVVDKGTAAFIPDMIRFYLGEEPLLDNGGYLLFIDKQGQPDPALLDEVFSQKDEWVIKPRGSIGKGHGVVVGPHTDHDTWIALKETVRQEPLAFVAQRYIEEVSMVLEPGRARSFEGRTILHVLGEPTSPGGSLFVGQGVYVRSATPGKLRNLSGSEGQADPASIIPVLIPR